MISARPVQLVIFGANGDLALRKLLPALVSALAHGRVTADLRITGMARRPLGQDGMRALAREALTGLPREQVDALCDRLDFHQGDVTSPDDMAALGRKLDQQADRQNVGRLFYLALAPQWFSPCVHNLGRAGLLAMREGEPHAWRRVVIEKPFGVDLATAQALNADLHQHLREEQIFRIDHYLGKETVQNLLGLRFHNAIFEPLWNRQHVELVQITVAESLGMERGRAAYYDQTGALRDVLQNHMLQVLALTAMEPPASLDAEAIRGQKVALLNSLHVPSLPEVAKVAVRGQYQRGEIDGSAVPAYRDEDGVRADSSTETYVAIRAEIDNWRWSGVPFLLRHGKRLGQRFTEVRVQFRTPPVQLFNRPAGMSEHDFRHALRDGSLCQIRPNTLSLAIQPREAITLSFGVKRPGPDMVMAPAQLRFDYRDAFGANTAPAYERLLQDAIHGDPTLFLRADEIEASWRFADAFVRAWQAPAAAPLFPYAAGSLGPVEAERLFVGCEGGWSRG